MDPKRPIYQCTARWTMQGLTKPVFDIVSCCTLQRQKVMRWVATVLLDKALFLKNWTALAKKKTFIWSSSTLKKLSIWTITCLSWLLSWSDFDSKAYKVWPPTKDSSYKVTYSFWLCVHTRCRVKKKLSFQQAIFYLSFRWVNIYAWKVNSICIRIKSNHLFIQTWPLYLHHKCQTTCLWCGWECVRLGRKWDYCNVFWILSQLICSQN